MKERILMNFSFLKFALIPTAIFCGSATYAMDGADETSKSKLRDLSPNYLNYDPVGVGLIWGTLTGVSAKYWADAHQAIEVTAAFADSNTAIGVDYLWNFRGALGSMSTLSSAYNLAPFVGAGLLSSSATSASNTRFFDHDTDNFNLAVRVPILILLQLQT